MKVKIKEMKGGLEVGENDVILYNEACYQIITQRVLIGYYETHPTISKTEFNRLLKQGLIFTPDMVYKSSYYYDGNFTLYKFKEVKYE